MNHLLCLDNVLTKSECDYIIEESRGSMTSGFHKDWMYEYSDFTNEFPSVLRGAQNTVESYLKEFPEMNMTENSWSLKQFRLKHFPANYGFTKWHSEHTYDYPYRIACILFYLTDHDCGTEFYNSGEVIKSKVGRAVIFPTSWTHTHRGQICPEGKSRYIISTYLHLNAN